MSRAESFSVIPVPGPGAEDVVVGLSGADEGAVFTGTEDGSIFRISHDGGKVDRIAQTQGRPLGLEIDLDGRLLVCDAHRGLLRVDTSNGAVEAVTAEVGGTPMKFCNNAAIASDGTVWFSDSSTKFGIEDWKSDFVQHTRTGRLMRLDVDGTITVVLDGLAFANGVALSKDEDFVVVAETGARTVVRRWLTGNRAGMRDLLCQGLPGYPDNVARGSDGLIWVTIASPTDPVVERLQRGPVKLRKLATMLPDKLQPKPKETVRVQAYDGEGVLVHDLDIDVAEHGVSYHMVTGVREHEGRVWMGSLHEAAVAVWDL
ncbi:SMP-30/gluconolactonase/LRE family protein [Nocardioides sp.]|jgi:sugar lactone lactonase YvrE|uniref:SMP-30/gluconolactonase/LRE family protein n=1 Tax=Nocardioides sp. TaxID=35761 RepID=UPI001D7E1AB6|nr:SMP-30/gluconolactonase/LRE family protein [Nocardioides sp.]MBU1802522.1 SMP-30/gluconolactonase/LRE family protein [Actinomycetota bacterium]